MIISLTILKLFHLYFRLYKLDDPEGVDEKFCRLFGPNFVL